MHFPTSHQECMVVMESLCILTAKIMQFMLKGSKYVSIENIVPQKRGRNDKIVLAEIWLKPQEPLAD